MGMFDSMIASDGSDWQTKALGRGLHRYNIGDKVPVPVRDCQLEVLGDSGMRWATVRGGALAAVPQLRDPNLPGIRYTGGADDDDE